MKSFSCIYSFLAAGLIFTLLSCQGEPIAVPKAEGEARGLRPDVTVTPSPSVDVNGSPIPSTPVNPSNDPMAVVPSFTPSAATDPVPNDGQYRNSDNSYTVVNPRWSYNGGLSPLKEIVKKYYDMGVVPDTSVTPALPPPTVAGVCNKFLFSNTLTQEMGDATTYTVPGIELTALGVETTRAFTSTAMQAKATILSVTCINAIVGNNLQGTKVQNTGGSVTINEPRFMYRGVPTILVEQVCKYTTAANGCVANESTDRTWSSATGLCKLLGFANRNIQELDTTPAASTLIVGIELGAQGAIKTANLPQPRFESGSQMNRYLKIKSVTCSN